MVVRLPEVSSSALAALGVPGLTDVLGVGSARHVVLCLIDGLGLQQLQAYSAHAPVLAGMHGEPCTASFPSTTPVGLASIGTGQEPGVHGFVGASFWLPDEEIMLSPLHWGSTPSPMAIQPESTVFERARREGIAVSAIGPEEYRESGLTRAVLRGADYRAAEDVAGRAAAVRDEYARSHAQGHEQRTLAYVYWPHLDRLGHEFGAGSAQWLAGLAQVDRLIQALLTELGGESALIVTSDHGMVNVDPASRVPLESTPGLRDDIVHIAGEPRMRHVYCREGSAADVRDRWASILGDRAQVLDREQVIATGLLGRVDPFLADRIGDVVAIARGGTVLASHVDPLVSALIGQHGADSVDEMLVPALVARG